MKPEEYLKNPCAASSLPFWKTNRIVLPEGVQVIRDDPFRGTCRHSCDTPYFKLIHRFGHLTRHPLPDGFSLASIDTGGFSSHISECYDLERISVAELEQYKNRNTYRADLWIAVRENKSGRIVAAGIAELDRTIREGVLEWIQVSPGFRRRGLGRFLVTELLSRMQKDADFVTVSGRLHNGTDPYALYESCGFSDPVIWHVIQKQ